MSLKALVASLAALIAIGYVGFLMLIYLAQSAILYPGLKRVAALTPPSNPGEETIQLPTPSGNVEAIFLPAMLNGGAARPLLIFGHGNGELIDDWVTRLDGFRERGIGVLLVEYPGYGRSAGSPSETSIHVAMNAAYDHMASDPRDDVTRIVGFGESLGGAALCGLAMDRPLRALILQSTFPTLSIFTAQRGAPAFLLKDRYDSLAVTARFAGPLLVIHGRRDTLIPWKQGRRLALASARSTFRLYDCGHDCWAPDRLPFWHDVDSFLASAGVS